MKALYARYPFLSAARATVDDLGVDLADIVTREDDPVVARARDRVESALTDGTIGTVHSTPRVELLSYPVSRVLVSLLDLTAAVTVYAAVEADAAHDRFTDEFDARRADLRSTKGDRLTLDAFLAEFDLSRHVTATEDGFDVDVGRYLALSDSLDDDRWRLVTRVVRDGRVRVDRSELYALLRGAVEERVADGLPLSVPDSIADALAPVVDELDEQLAGVDVSGDIDAVVPELFPPCMTALLESARDADRLDPSARFALTAFGTAIGLDADELVDLFDAGAFEETSYEYQAAVLGTGGDAQYLPPSCDAMVAYGLCVNKDDLCRHIEHPLEYYEERLDRAGGDRIDWRERV